MVVYKQGKEEISAMRKLTARMTVKAIVRAQEYTHGQTKARNEIEAIRKNRYL